MLTKVSIKPFLACRSFFKYLYIWKTPSSSAKSKLASIAKYIPVLPPPSLKEDKVEFDKTYAPQLKLRVRLH